MITERYENIHLPRSLEKSIKKINVQKNCCTKSTFCIYFSLALSLFTEKPNEHSLRLNSLSKDHFLKKTNR